MWPFTKRKPKAKPLALSETSARTQQRREYYSDRLRAAPAPDWSAYAQADNWRSGPAMDARAFDPTAYASIAPATDITPGGGDFGGGGSSGSWDSPSSDSGSSYDSGSSSCDSGGSGGGGE